MKAAVRWITDVAAAAGCVSRLLEIEVLPAWLSSQLRITFNASPRPPTWQWLWACSAPVSGRM
jgi:hypothetical protein